MGLEELRKGIIANAENQAGELASEARQEAEKIIDEARKQAQEIAARAKEEAKQVAGEEERRVSSARLRARMIVASARDEAVEKAVNKLSERVKRAAGKKNLYEKIFSKLCTDASKQMNAEFTVHCRKQDLALAKKFFGPKARISQKFIDSSGIILASLDERIRFDNTLEAILEDRKSELKQTAFHLFFEKRE